MSKIKEKEEITENIEETTEETVEETTDETAPPKKGKKIDIMDSSDSAEPPKKKAEKKEFSNKMDLTPVLEAINGLSESLKKPEPTKKEPELSKGFMDVLGDW